NVIEDLLVVRINWRRWRVLFVLVPNGVLQLGAGAIDKRLVRRRAIFLGNNNQRISGVALRQLRPGGLHIRQQRAKSEDAVLLCNIFGECSGNQTIQAKRGCGYVPKLLRKEFSW